MSAMVSPCGDQLGPKFLSMGPTWGQVVPCWIQVVPKLEPSGNLGRSWGLVGQSWPFVEPILRQCRIETDNFDDENGSAPAEAVPVYIIRC
jgi:hypothetical protein